MSSPSMKRLDDGSEPVAMGDPSRQRKFFPRLKTLLSDEYEDFLRQIIETIEASQCATYSMATADTPWADAFEAIYKTVAQEYALPQGKNRLHKFKEKMCELWQAMYNEVALGVKSEAHPVYRMACKQWRQHQSIMKDKTKSPSNPVYRNGSEEVLDVVEDADLQDSHEPARPRKKARGVDAMRRSGSGSHHGDGDLLPVAGNSGATGMTYPVSPNEMMESWTRSLGRLENMLVSSGFLQPKLPSPLYELHRLKSQMTPMEFNSKVLGPYEVEIGRYLSHVSAQCRTTSVPNFLPQILEGLDALRQSPQSSSIRKSLDYTHRQVLNKYIRMISRESNNNTSSNSSSNNNNGNVKNEPQQAPMAAVAATAVAGPTDTEPPVLEAPSVDDEEGMMKETGTSI